MKRVDEGQVVAVGVVVAVVAVVAAAESERQKTAEGGGSQC